MIPNILNHPEKEKVLLEEHETPTDPNWSVYLPRRSPLLGSNTSQNKIPSRTFDGYYPRVMTNRAMENPTLKGKTHYFSGHVH